METSIETSLPSAEVQLAKIRDLEWYIADVSELIDKKQDPKQDMSLSLNAQYRLEPEKRMFVLRLTIIFKRPLTTDTPEDVVRCTVEMQYMIVNFAEVVSDDNKENYVLPMALLEMFFSVSVSTMRGIITEKTANSYFKDLYIPLLDTKAVAEHIFG